MTALFTKKITIYNDIPADAVNPRRFGKFVVDKCMIYNQAMETADSTIQRVINSQNVITKDIKHYKTPIEYMMLPDDEKKNFYTVQIDDFVVLADIDDVVTTSREYEELQSKYANNGFLVTAVNASIYGLSVDNVLITHA